MKRKRSRMLWRAVATGVLLLVIAMLAALGWLLMVYPQRGPGGDGRVVELRIEAPSRLDDLANRLEREGVIERAWIWAAYMRVIGGDRRLRVGHVRVIRGMSPAEVVRAVAVGFGPTRVRVTIPEGRNRFEVAAELERFGVCPASAFVAHTANLHILRGAGVEGSTAEGYLFPDTYELREWMPVGAVFTRLTTSWRRRVLPLIEQHPEGLAALRRDLGWGLHEVTILASIVEKEAAVPDERPIIAGVFLNRLRDPSFRPRRLQADPTVAYGCTSAAGASQACQAFDGRHITRAMLADTGNPYNTYRFDGLPPGPICNPGVSSIAAVLAPAQHRYFYFVARGGGRHQFSETLEEHNAAIDAVGQR